MAKGLISKMHKEEIKRKNTNQEENTYIQYDLKMGMSTTNWHLSRALSMTEQQRHL